MIERSVGCCSRTPASPDPHGDPGKLNRPDEMRSNARARGVDRELFIIEKSGVVVPNYYYSDKNLLRSSSSLSSLDYLRAAVALFSAYKRYYEQRKK